MHLLLGGWVGRLKSPARRSGVTLGDGRDRATRFVAYTRDCRTRSARRKWLSQKRSDDAAEGQVINMAEALKATKAFAAERYQCSGRSSRCSSLACSPMRTWSCISTSTSSFRSRSTRLSGWFAPATACISCASGTPPCGASCLWKRFEQCPHPRLPYRVVIVC